MQGCSTVKPLASNGHTLIIQNTSIILTSFSLYDITYRFFPRGVLDYRGFSVFYSVFISVMHVYICDFN